MISNSTQTQMHCHSFGYTVCEFIAVVLKVFCDELKVFYSIMCTLLKLVLRSGGHFQNGSCICVL